VSEESVFSDTPPASRRASCDVGLPASASAGERAAMRLVAAALGDADWPQLVRCLRLRSAGVHSVRRRAQLRGCDRRQTTLEILSSWFRAQPRSSNKVSAALIRNDTRCYFDVRSKAGTSQLNLPHGTNS